MSRFIRFPVVLATLLTIGACTTPSDVPKQQANIPAPLTIAQDGPCCGPITPKAQHILDVLDASNVDHTAIVRPNAKRTLAQIEESGTEVTQAGEHNHLHATERKGFSMHHGAWPNGVEYFAHDLPDQLSSQTSD